MMLIVMHLQWRFSTLLNALITIIFGWLEAEEGGGGIGQLARCMSGCNCDASSAVAHARGGKCNIYGT